MRQLRANIRQPHLTRRASTVYNPRASGDTKPLRVIRGAKASEAVPGMGNPHPIAYDTMRQQLLVPN